MVHMNNYPEGMFEPENKESEPDWHPLASIDWPLTSKVWRGKVTLLNVSELLECMALKGDIKEIVKLYALREITDIPQNATGNVGIDEEELIGKIFAFVEGYEAACKQNGIKVAWKWHNYRGKNFQDDGL
jgi:hypothetical protein